MHGGSRQLELKKEPIEKRRYSERRVILLADKFSINDYFRLARQPSHLCFVSRDQTENVDWPAGHPVSDTLYIGHPLKPTIYYLATEFHNRLFDDKVVEFSKMLRYLGAKIGSAHAADSFRLQDRFCSYLFGSLGWTWSTCGAKWNALGSPSFSGNTKLNVDPCLPNCWWKWPSSRLTS